MYKKISKYASIYHQGDVFYADLRKNTRGSEQDGVRPVVVVQNEAGNRYGNTLIVTPITSQFQTGQFTNQRKKYQSTQVLLNKNQYHFLREDSKIITEQIRTIDKKRVVTKQQVGHLKEIDRLRLQQATIVSLGLVEDYEKRDILRGEIYLADLGKGIGYEFKGLVPIVIIQNNIGNKYSPTTIMVPIKLNSESKLPTHVLLSEEHNPNVNINQMGVILAEQIRTIDKTRLVSKIGQLPDYIMDKVDEAIINSLQLDRGLIYDLNFKKKISHTV